MFNYCGNNPVIRLDNGGSSWILFFGLVAFGFLGGKSAESAYVQTNIALGSDNPYAGSSGAFMSGAVGTIMGIVSPATPFLNVVAASTAGTITNVIYEKAPVSGSMKSLPLDIAMNYGVSKYTSTLKGKTGLRYGDLLLDSWSGTTIVNINNDFNKKIQKGIDLIKRQILRKPNNGNFTIDNNYLCKQQYYLYKQQSFERPSLILPKNYIDYNRMTFKNRCDRNGCYFIR